MGKANGKGFDRAAAVRVNRDGDRNDDGRGSVVDRAALLAARELRLWAGEECVEAYVHERMDIAIRGVRDLVINWTEDSISVVVAIPAGGPFSESASLCALALTGGVIRPIEITDDGVRRVSGGTAIEAALNSQAPGSYQVSDFIDVARLGQMLVSDASIKVTSDRQQWVASGAERFRLNGNSVLRLHLSPTD